MTHPVDGNGQARLSDQQLIPDSPADQESFGYDDVIRSLMAACPAYEGSPERAAVDDGDFAGNGFTNDVMIALGANPLIAGSSPSEPGVVVPRKAKAAQKRWSTTACSPGCASWRWRIWPR